MNHPRDDDFSANELAEFDALLSDAVELRAAMHSLHARELEIMHKATQLAERVQGRMAISRQGAGLPYRTVAAEFGAAFRISDRSVQRMMGEADTIFTMFRAAAESLGAGRISPAHVRVLVEAGAHITDAEARAEFEAAALSVAERESASRLRPFAKRLAEQLHPRSLTERHEAASDERAVRIVDLPDGMGELIATLPGALVHAAYDRLSAMAREVARASAAEAKDVASGEAAGWAHGAAVPEGAHCRDERTMDQLRADILADLLLAGAPEGHIATGLGAIRASVQLVIPMLALLGRSEEPATLAGVGPIDAETARRLAGGAKGWDRVLTHPISGAVVATDRYRPGKNLKRVLQVRDQHCRFPGCRMPVQKCDLDHSIDFALGGATCEGNLAHLCRRHHTLKHESAWRVVQKPGGVLEWTSPTGRVYPDIPTSRVLFRPDAGAPRDMAQDVGCDTARDAGRDTAWDAASDEVVHDAIFDPAPF